MPAGGLVVPGVDKVPGLGGLRRRLADLEVGAAAVDGRVSAVESTDATLDGRLGTAETSITSLDGRVTTLESSSGGATWIVKPTDETVTSLSQQDDNDLTFAMAANTAYLVEMLLVGVGAQTSSDISVGYSIPSGASASLLGVGGPSGLSSYPGPAYHALVAASGTPFGLLTSDSLVWFRGVVRCGATAGSFTLRWAPLTAYGSTVKAGSWMRVEPGA